MIWVTWRHHRTSLIVSLGFIAALAIAAIVGGIGTRSSLGAEGRGTYFGCVGVGWDCWADTAVTGVNTIAAALPALLGALVGATVFSRDIDQQTHVLGLTQSVSRARWFWMRVVVVFLPLTAAAAILGFILEAARVGFESWSYVVNVGPVQSYGMSSMLFPLFNSSGIVLGAYTFMALVAGAAVSLLVRSPIAAVAVTLVAVAGLMVGFQNLARPHYAEPTVLTQGIDHDTFYATYLMDSSMAWVIRSGYTDANGKPVEIDYQACTNDTAGNEYDQRSDESDVDFYVRQKAFLAQLDAEYRACVLAQGVDHYETWYHSVDQVRRFQFTEAALVLILSGLFLLPALWGLRRLKP